MTQDQNAQTTNANDTIISPVSEQDLQDITGGCLSCGIVGLASSAAAGYEMGQGIKKFATGEVNAAEQHAHKSQTFLGIGQQSLKNGITHALNGGRTWKPCAECKLSAGLAVATHLWNAKYLKPRG